MDAVQGSVNAVQRRRAVVASLQQAALRLQQRLRCSCCAGSARSLCSVSMCAGVAVEVGAMLLGRGAVRKAPPFCGCACSSSAVMAGDWLHPVAAVAAGCSGEPAAYSSGVWCQHLVGKDVVGVVGVP